MKKRISAIFLALLMTINAFPLPARARGVELSGIGNNIIANINEDKIEAPETEAPEIEKPEIGEPEIEKPAIEEPAIEEPAIEEPEIEEPAIEEPAIEEPAIEEPEIEEPEIEEPGAVYPPFPGDEVDWEQVFLDNIDMYAETYLSFQGDGSTSSPFIISYPSHILLIRDAIENETMIHDVDASGAYYELDSDIDMLTTDDFYGIGTFQNPFKGHLDGKGFTITLAIENKLENVAGFIRYGEGASISNLQLTGSVTGFEEVGGLIGRGNDITMSQVQSEVTVTGTKYVGGLVGKLTTGRLTNVSGSGIITSDNHYVGGLIGEGTDIVVEDSHSEGSVGGVGTKIYYAGGLVGNILGDSSIKNSHSTATVTGYVYVGGLVGMGDGVSISGSNFSGAVSYVQGNSSYGGIIGYMNNSELIDIEVSGNIKGVSYVGGVAGYGYNSLIQNAIVTVDIIGGNYTGGILGRGDNVRLQNVEMSGKTTGGSNVGGILGEAYSKMVTIEGATVSGDIKGNSNVGGVIGNGGLVTLRDVKVMPIRLEATYAGVSYINMIIGSGTSHVNSVIENTRYYITGQVEPRAALLYADGSLIDESLIERTDTGFVITVPVSKSVGTTEVTNNRIDSLWLMADGYSSREVPMSLDNGRKIYDLALVPVVLEIDSIEAIEGLGTGASPFIINNLEQFKKIATLISQGISLSGVVASEAYYELSKDLDLSSYAGFTGLGNQVNPFKGHLDGKGFTITLAIENKLENVAGFIRYGEGASISNLDLTGSVTGLEEVGGLIGRGNDITVSQVHSEVTVTGNKYVGGLVGKLTTGNLTNVTGSGIITSDNHYVGGLIGEGTDIVMEDSHSAGQVGGLGTNVRYAGGLVGNILGKSSIKNSHSTATMTGYLYVGGLVGMGNGVSISGSNFSGAVSYVSGSSYYGGIIGHMNNSELIDIELSVNIRGGSYVGGVAGAGYNSLIQNAVVTGDIIGGNYTGGILGRGDNVRLQNVEMSGKTTGGSNVGGILGEVYSKMATIEGATVSGDIRGNSNVGGVIGNGGPVTLRDVKVMPIRLEATYAGVSYVNMIIGSGTSHVNSVIENTRYYITGQVEPRAALLYADGSLIDESLIERTDNGFVITVPVSKSVGTTEVTNNRIDSLWFMADGYSSREVPMSLDNGRKIYDLTLAPVVLEIDSIEAIEGLGTGASPFIINNLEQFKKIATLISQGISLSGVVASEAYYELSKDLDLSSYAGFTGLGNQVNPFKGHLDGKGLTITLAIENKLENVAGFIRYGEGASISNLQLTGSVTGFEEVGGLIGRGNDITMSQVQSEVTVTGTKYVGGLVGKLTTGRLTEVSGTGTITGNKSYIGGLIGEGTDIVMEDSRSAGLIQSTSNYGEYVGGLVGNI